MPNNWADRWLALSSRLDGVGNWLAPLGLRLILAWEFWEAGREKLRGENWFGQIQDKFPFPFDQVPPGLSWSLATWTELVAAVALLLGLGTRLAAFALLVLTAVATASVHWPADWSSLAELWQGYAITDRGHGNFKLPLLFALMLLPLLFKGPGRLSLDALLARHAGLEVRAPVCDLSAWALGLAVTGLPLALLMPAFGLSLLGLALLLGLLDRLLLR
ncbi:DoxX family protein [Arenimonas fontis]|uniref:DoxX family protein n=1 Tax=Arenimonas fontis TaxID=2608255 RepID=A0A5B2ZAM6_9GAMM|nr:DoxX family protein [Arenimonas fontis]KAA2285738.1 DoxX family protein [Arenimonas fontis]